MLFRATSPEAREERARAKERKRIDRLRRRGNFADAIDAQRKLCEASPRDAAGWTQLAEICREGRRLDLALAARYEAAKVLRSGAAEWLELAEEAEDWGFASDAVEARFRAADAYAIAGELPRALELLDEVLRAAPEHPQAKRIRRLVVSRMPDPPPEPTPAPPAEPSPAADEQEQEQETTLSFVGDRAHRAGRTGVDEVPDDVLVEEATRQHFPEEVDLGTTDRPTPAGFVCSPLVWPSVLDTRTLTFVGSVASLGTELLGLTETIVLGEGSPAYIQGHSGQLLYLLESGLIQFSRERPGRQDLGTVKPGHFFGEIGALMGLPSTVTATAVEPCLLRVVSRREVQQQVEGGQGVPPLISLLRAWYLETVLHLCPLFVADTPAWPEGEGIHWITVRPGDRLATTSEAGPMRVVVTGFARVAVAADGEEKVIGYLCPGDPCGEIDPSPVDVIAESVVTALQLPRDQLDCLTPAGRGLLEERVARCRAALGANPYMATGEVRELIVPADEIFASAAPEAASAVTAATAAPAVTAPADQDAPAAAVEAEQARDGEDAPAADAEHNADAEHEADGETEAPSAQGSGGLQAVRTAETLADDEEPAAGGDTNPER